MTEDVNTPVAPPAPTGSKPPRVIGQDEGLFEVPSDFDAPFSVSPGSALIPRRRFHRAVFVLAGLYNIGWGIFSAVDPQWLFRFAGMPLSPYPEIFACLAMVVGLYGILYLEVARRPEHGWLLAAVGLVGKILGPIGLGMLILRGTWPPATIILCLTNDFIWWIPFGIYLVDAWPEWRREVVRS